MMLWHDIFWARKDIESNLHRPVKLVHPSLTATKNNFLNSGGLMKLMHVCLCVRSNIKNSFQHCGGPVMFCRPFVCLEECRKQFS